MQGAPALEWTIGSGHRERALVALIWVAAGIVLGAWTAQWLEWPMSSWGGVATAALPGVAMGVLGWTVCSPMSGALAWDGRLWHWRDAPQGPSVPATGLRIAFDLGGWAVLRDDRGRWCGVCRADAPAQWHGLRLALHAIHGHAIAGDIS